MTKAKTNTKKTLKVLVLGSVTGPVERAGARAVTLRLGDDRAQDAISKGAVQGLLLTGGGDVDPLLYAKKRHSRVYGVNEQRDLAEWNAIAAADEAGIPVLGICRGSQILNVAYGGTLHQNLDDVETAHRHHNGGDHRVKAARGSRLAKAWGRTNDYTRWVISLHHQAVKDVAPGFVATGWGLDGTIEAIEKIEGWVLGVQFHPEMASGQAHHQRIFDRFVAEAAKVAGLEWKLPVRRDQKTQPRHSAIAAYDIERDDVWRHIPQNRKTTYTRPRKGSWDTPVLSRWRCFRCDVDFDERADHLDHMLFLHGVDLLAEGVTA